jgi:GrpB-like predicted nucleotidyltransferase (UPF0157 family)
MDVTPERMKVVLVPHSAEWSGVAQREAGRLGRAIGETLVAVHHIGSTSIPDIMAKPTVDLLPVVRDLGSLDARQEAVQALGYDWCGEFGLPGRRFLRMTVDGKRLFNVHCYEQSNPEVTRHLAFRDYLRAHPDVAREYEAQKIRAAQLQPDDVLLYNDAKNDWIKDTEKLALAWYGR